MMPNVYIEAGSLTNAIDYFSNINYTSPEQLGIFFFFKSIGLTEKEYIAFPKVSQMSVSEKDFYNKKLHQLGGLFTHTETGKKRTCLFPFAIDNPVKNKGYFNGGSEFKGLLSRLTDTIDNTLIDKFLDKNENNEIKFKRGYIKYVKDTFLNGRKISVTYLSAWISRFTEFNVGTLTGFTNVEFTRVCTKDTKKFLKLNELEMQELFEEDSNTISLGYSTTMISGSDFRSLMNYDEAPDVTSEPNTLNLNSVIVNQTEVKKYMELNDKNPTSDEIKEVLKLKKQVILYGVPGVGKSKFISDLEADYPEDNIIKLQFHPSTSYEDFIGGETVENGTVVTRPGVFLEACKRAEAEDGEKFLFILDEINRGNISKIFGETILALDREYEVDLIKPLGEITEFSIPDNMDIVATMNSADRSIAILDFAIRRRFGFIKLYPNYEIVGHKSDLTNININVETLFRALNTKILNTLNDEDLLLGQSYFLPKFADIVNDKIQWKTSDLRYIFNYSIIPALEEYTYGNKNDLLNILGEKLIARPSDDNEFEQSLLEYFPECNK